MFVFWIETLNKSLVNLSCIMVNAYLDFGAWLSDEMNKLKCRLKKYRVKTLS